MLPSGIFFKSHGAEQAYLRTTHQRLALGLLLAAIAVLPLLGNDYLTGILTTAAITIIAVAGLQITTGMSGLLNLGQSAFVGIGAFTAASLYSNYGVPVPICLVLAGLVSGTVSILFSLPAMRIKGLYLALTTIAAQVMLPIVVLRLPTGWFGGAAGIGIDEVRIFGLALGTPSSIYYLVMVVMALMLCMAFNLARSRTGRAFRAMRDNDIASSVMGVNLAFYKVLSFFAGAMFAGVAGGLYAFYIRYVTIDQFTLWLSVWYVGMLIVGGLGSPLGAILGTLAITVLQEAVRAGGNYAMSNMTQASGGLIFAATNVLLGAAIIAMLIVEPLGLTRRWNVLKSAYRIWPYPRA